MFFPRSSLCFGVLLTFCIFSRQSARAQVSDAFEPVVIQVQGTGMHERSLDTEQINSKVVAQIDEVAQNIAQNLNLSVATLIGGRTKQKMLNPPIECCDLLVTTIRAYSKLASANHNISIIGDDFMVDGQPLHIMSGSLHYFRLPAAYWRETLRKLKAAGLNSISTYVEWSFHEPEERQYNFAGDRDITTFIKMAAEEGLHVLLRPGPYICAERDLGGFPYWLLGKYPNIMLRTTDKDFIDETKIWMEKLFEQLKPLLFGNGGPIILVQVENEYGSYGADMPYKEAIRDILLKHVGNSALLYTTDGWDTKYFVNGAVSGALTTIDFGPTTQSAVNVFRQLRRFMRSGPLMNSEYYTGWLTHWREEIAHTSTEEVVRTLKDMLDNKINVNFYVFFGGTNFEFTAGANYDGTYQPDITSYDYDAALSEARDPTPKYYAIREALKSYNLVDTNIDPPQPAPKGDYGTVAVTAKLNLLSSEGRTALGKKYNDVSGPALPTFESLRQRGGLVLYETTINGGMSMLEIQKPRDLVFVFVDGEPVGKISRMKKIYSLPLTSKNDSVLSLLVENQGRINFGPLIHDYKGILSVVKYDTKVLNGKWKVTGYPLENVELESSDSQRSEPKVPTIYIGHLKLPEGQEPLDTFIDTTGWGKGFIWINGHNLGRYWPPVGPQITLYVPGVWLKPFPETNHLQILELDKPSKDLNVRFIDHPILNRTGNIYLWN